MSHTRLRGIVAALICTALALIVCPAPAAAVTQEEVDAAQSQLDSITAEYENAYTELNRTVEDLKTSGERLSGLEEQVAETTVRFEKAQSDLREYTRGSYKQGTLTMLDAVLSARSFEELVSAVHYARRVEEYGTQVVNTANEVRHELELEQADLIAQIQEQDNLRSQQEEQLTELDAAKSSQQSYLDGLSAELREQIDLERARAAEKAAKEAQEKAAAEASKKEAEAKAEAGRQAAEQQNAANNNNNQQQPAPEQPQVTPVAPDQIQGDVVTGEDIARLAVSVAATASPEGRIQVATPHTRPTDPRCAGYLAIHDAVYGRMFPPGTYTSNYPYYASCSPAVYKVIQYANADTVITELAASRQGAYFRNSELWEYIPAPGGASFDQVCQPGDVINNSGHTMLYVGNALVRERFPNSNGGMWEASEGGRFIPGITDANYRACGGWDIYRLRPRANPHVY